MKTTQPGRKAFAPTDAQRALVSSSTPGTPQRDIATSLNISVPTLRKAFAAELRARTPATTAPQGTLFATPANPPAPPPAPRSPAHHPARPGRPRYQPCESDRQKLQLMLATGNTLATVALALGVSEPTLNRAYASDIKTAAAVKLAETLSILHRQARAGSTSAAAKLLERIDRAELAAIQRSMQSPAMEPKKPAPGKKEQADIDASRVLSESEWSDILPQGTA